MSLQFADFDADGHEDIVTAVWQGSVHIVRGSEAGWQAPERIRDKNGADILLSRYYDMETNEYLNADKPAGDDTVHGDHCVSAYALDWEGDGDLDLLLGAKDGRLYLQRNEGKAGAPAFTGINEQVELENGYDFEVPGGMTAARQVDWDGDGLLDLVCGSFKGGAYWYRNVGEKNAPAFDEPVALLKPGEDVGDGSNGPASDWYVTPVDYDADGDLDLLVGGHFQSKPEKPVLNEEETAELARLQARSRELNEAVNSVYDEIFEEFEGKDQSEVNAAIQKAFHTEEMQKNNEEMQIVRKRLQELDPQPQRTSGVWLYARETRG